MAGTLTCPLCGAEIVGFLQAAGPAQPPSPGDACVCQTCGDWAIVAEDGSMRPPTAFELLGIALELDRAEGGG